MEDRLTHLRLMLGKLARGEEPYGGGRFDAKHLEIDQADAQVLSGALDELEVRRARVTTGGPAPGFTQPPEEIVVAIPVSDEERAGATGGGVPLDWDPVWGDVEQVEYACDDCGQPHPPWITCETEAERLAVDHVEKPPDR